MLNTHAKTNRLYTGSTQPIQHTYTSSNPTQPINKHQSPTNFGGRRSKYNHFQTAKTGEGGRRSRVVVAPISDKTINYKNTIT